jgi:hypothetical protein
MNKLTRRTFLMSTAALSVGCAAPQLSMDESAKVRIRPPSVGQSWRYAQFDYFTGDRVDTEVDQVVAVDPTIQILSEFERHKRVPVQYPSWGKRWWQRYIHADEAGKLPLSEFQESWGMVVVDPHWAELQAYEKPIPLWPKELRPGWWTMVSTDYMIPTSRETMPWQLTMYAERWESVTVPAGRFHALRCYNIINFRFTNVSERTTAQRIEHYWFVPEIGRWALRESVGTFREDLGTEVKESSYRWELLEWT